VIISLKFPITFHKKTFKLYNILSFPVPINDTSRDTTLIVDINDYFPISTDERYHVSLPRSTINQCVGISLMTCPIHPLLKTMKEPDCEAVLFQNKKTEIHSKCNFRFFRNIVKPHILDLTTTQLLVYQTKNLTLQCKEGTKVLKGCDFCIMTVPCQCSIISTNMRFNQQVNLCQKDTCDISILYPVNLALLQQCFNESQLTEILANTSFNKPVQVKIPSFMIYEHKMSKLFAKDVKESLNLKKMAERTKKDQVIFSTLAESLADGEITIDEEGWPKKEDVMTLMAGGINIIVIIWLIYKVRILSAAILVSTRLPQVSSLRLQYTLPITTTPSSWSDILNQNLKWDQGVFIISFLTFGGLLGLLYSHFMKRPRNTRICLEITTGFQCVLLDIKFVIFLYQFFLLEISHIFS
jgi:hypothetical protein